MLTKVLVANRGEIARRVIRTCHDLGIDTVAVYTDPDRDLPYVREADEAVRIGAGPAATSFLDPDRILEAARRTGADAVHPGYGFLSESAELARAVIAADLTWIGPPVSAIAATGDKAAARRIAAANHVPTVPGYDGDDTSNERLAEEAARIGFPVLVKATGGGGGRGMRRVDEPGDLAEAVASARREALSAFGSDAVLLERCLERPRHVEVQIFGDTHGNVVHLGERECSIQRRHQKLVEEAPSPAVDEALRQSLGDAAIRIARAVGYVGAGTVEFLLDASGSFYFLEVNARLQVEHPVTEAVTGLDLVAWQIAVAEGRPLPLTQDQIRLNGHAIEVRLIAEDPHRDWLPATGRLHRFALDGARVDAGYGQGDAIGPHYDSLVAKLIAWGPDRATATRRLRRAVNRAWLPGPVTNLPLLRDILAHPAWQAAELDTAFLARTGLPLRPPLNLRRGALAATAVELVATAPWDPHVPNGWRPWGRASCVHRFTSFGEDVEVTVTPKSPGWTLEVASLGATSTHQVRRIEVDGDDLRLVVDGVHHRWRVARVGDTAYVHLGDGEAMLVARPRHPAPEPPPPEPGACVAPTPGTVVRVTVTPGEVVDAGQVLVVVEAMKMEHAVAAPEAGTVAEVRVATGDAVDQGQLLVRLDT